MQCLHTIILLAPASATNGGRRPESQTCSPPSDALSTLYAVIFVVGNKQSFNSPLSDTRSARMIDLISGAGVSCLPKYLRAVIAVIGNT